MEVIDRSKSTKEVNCILIYSFDFMCQANLIDTRAIIACGKEPDRDREFNAMIINLLVTLLPMALHELNDTGSPFLAKTKVIEHW